MSASSVDVIGSFPQDQILGIGRTGLVILHQGTAIKLPLRWSTSSDDDVEANIESLQHEQDIYQRLGQHAGIVQCLGFSDTATHLVWMRNGDLRSYLTQNRPPKSLQLSWFRNMARTLAYIHDQHIIVADIASRNFLLDSDLSIKFCDFTESSKIPLDVCMETATDGGYSIQTDIGQLGAVIYEVVVGEHCQFDLFKDVPMEIGLATWPQRKSLPSTQGVWLGQIIEKCWTEGVFRNAYDLLNELEAISIEDEPVQCEAEKCLGSSRKGPDSIHRIHIKQSVSALAVTFGAVGILALWIWRRPS